MGDSDTMVKTQFSVLLCCYFRSLVIIQSSAQQLYVTHIGLSCEEIDSRAWRVYYLDINLSSHVNYYFFCQDIH